MTAERSLAGLRVDYQRVGDEVIARLRERPEVSARGSSFGAAYQALKHAVAERDGTGE